MMCDMSSVMGPMVGVMMTYSAIVSLLVLAVPALLAVWLFQLVRRGGATGPRP